ncbi:MAG: YraN family protein [Thiotrichales bacterium]|nr:YraN family protein [Thiotrichales bacterium]
MNTGVSARVSGRKAEDIACKHLENSGMQLLSRNFHGRFGEIDLVMRKDPIVVFVEVRYRNNNRVLETSETIDTRKCTRIIKTAQQFMQSMKDPDQFQFRFDVVTITGTLDDPAINWIQDAFQA